MSKKRKKVYELAKKYGVLIIEDNPYAYCVSQAICSEHKKLDTQSRTVLLPGSFSKVISPGMRVAHTADFQKLVVCKQGNDVHTNIWSQYATR